MKRKIATALVALTLLAAPAMACVGMLVKTEWLTGAMACTYQLSDGSYVRVILPGASYCPPCLN